MMATQGSYLVNIQPCPQSYLHLSSVLLIRRPLLQIPCRCRAKEMLCSSPCEKVVAVFAMMSLPPAQYVPKRDISSIRQRRIDVAFWDFGCQCCPESCSLQCEGGTCSLVLIPPRLLGTDRPSSIWHRSRDARISAEQHNTRRVVT